MPNYDSSYTGAQIDAGVKETNNLEVADITALKNLSPATAQVVLVADGAWYRWADGDATTAVDRIIIESTVVGYRSGDANDGRWKAQLEGGGYNVKWFGAVGDYDYDGASGTDDTTALQDALAALGTHGTLYIPTTENGYYFTDYLYVTREQSIVSNGARLYTNGKSLIVGSSTETANIGFENPGKLEGFQIRSTETQAADGRIASSSKGMIYGGGDMRTPTLSCTTNGTTTLTTAGSFYNPDGVAPVTIGAKVVGTGIANNTFIVSIESAISATMSKAATASATNTMTFYNLRVQKHNVRDVYLRGFATGLYSSNLFACAFFNLTCTHNNDGVFFEFNDGNWVAKTQGAGPNINFHGGAIGTNYRSGLRLKGTSLDGVNVACLGTDIENNGLEQSTLNGDSNKLFGVADVWLEDFGYVTLYGCNHEGPSKPNPRYLVNGGILVANGCRVGGCSTTETVTTTGAFGGGTVAVSAITNAMPVGTVLDFSGGETLTLDTKADAGATSLSGTATGAIAGTETATFGIKGSIELQEHATRISRISVSHCRLLGSSNLYSVWGYSGGATECSLFLAENVISGTLSNGVYDELIRINNGNQIEFYPGTNSATASLKVGHRISIDTFDSILPELRFNGVTVAAQVAGASLEVDAYGALGKYKVDGTKVIGTQAAAISDASGGGTVDTEARAALNDLLAKLRTHGLIAT